MAKRKKNSDESALIVPKHGRGKLLRGGKPGNKGGGRRPGSFAAFVRSLHDRDAVREAIEDAAADSGSRGFSPVLKLMAEYDPERPAPPAQQLTGELIVRVVRDDPEPQGD